MRVVVRTTLVERHVARPVVHEDSNDERSNADRCAIIFLFVFVWRRGEVNGEICVLLVWPMFEN